MGLEQLEARNRLLPDWLTKIRTHQIVLPRFQRFQAWSHQQVTGLLNNVLQELPAGAVLILEIGEKEPFHSRPVVGAPDSGERVTEHLLDGQQRLTALWRSLHDHYEDRSYFVVLDISAKHVYISSLRFLISSSSSIFSEYFTIFALLL